MSAGDFDRVTSPVRLYRGDIALLLRVSREQTVKPAEIVHEQLAQLRLDERAAERERGNGT